jgi:putative flippase GtrA
LGILPKIDYLVAQVIAFILSVLWSFFWNNKFVFKKDEDEHRNPWAALAKTYVSYAFTGLFLNTVLSIIWVDLLSISKLIAPIINLLVSVPINFFLNKLWAFKTDKKQ